jgi:predicted transcriptional regulator
MNIYLVVSKASTTTIMSYQQDKIDLYIERVNMAHSHYNKYKKTQWSLESSLNKIKEIENILQKEINKEKKDENEENHESCAICLESLQNKTIVTTKCKHSYCYDCIEANKQNNQYTGELCTICRTNIFSNT